MEKESKLLHSEILEGTESQVTARVVNRMDEGEAKVYDFDGSGIMGVVFKASVDGRTEAQSFIIGLTIDNILRGVDSILSMVQEQLNSDDDITSELAKLGLACMLAAKADELAS